MSRSRLKPLQPHQWGKETQSTLDATVTPVSELEGDEDSPAASDAKPLNILGTIAHHPHLLEPFLAFAATLALRGVLSRRQSELLALRAAWNCRSAFEWGHHAIYASAAGLSDSEIERVAAGAKAEGWTEEERELLNAADELHSQHDLSEVTWSLLRARFSDAQLVEIPFIVGNYTMLSMVANATGVPLEEDLPPLPATV